MGSDAIVEPARRPQTVRQRQVALATSSGHAARRGDERSRLRQAWRRQRTERRWRRSAAVFRASVGNETPHEVAVWTAVLLVTRRFCRCVGGFVRPLLDASTKEKGRRLLLSVVVVVVVVGIWVFAEISDWPLL